MLYFLFNAMKKRGGVVELGSLQAPRCFIDHWSLILGHGLEGGRKVSSYLSICLSICLFIWSRVCGCVFW